MTKQEVVAAVYEGKLVTCTQQEYESEIRSTLQECAGRWIDAGQTPRAIIALNEVQRLDSLFAAVQKSSTSVQPSVSEGKR